VYYNSLGHHADIVEMPQVIEMMRSGFKWAAAGKAVANNKTGEKAEVYTGMADNQT
jgi:type 1 glutamine amidotransferase